MKNNQIHKAIHNHIGEERVFSKEEERELITKLENNQSVRTKKKWLPEVLGWSLGGAAFLLMFGIVGSQTGLLSFSGDRQPDKLDISLLEEDKSHGLEDMSEEQREKFESIQPKTYHADTVEDALKSLPFKLTLPETIPFEAKFTVEGINDWHFESNTDGKDISVDFRAIDNSGSFILIQAVDFEQEFFGDNNQEEVELKKDLTGKLEMVEDGGEIRFENNEEVYINIYFHDAENRYITRKILIDLANQMIE